MIIGLFGLYIHFLHLYEIYIRPWRYISVKKYPIRKNISKGGYGTDTKPMETIVPNITRKVKGGHFGRTYGGNTIPITKVLH